MRGPGGTVRKLRIVAVAVTLLVVASGCTLLKSADRYAAAPGTVAEPFWCKPTSGTAPLGRRLPGAVRPARRRGVLGQLAPHREPRDGGRGDVVPVRHRRRRALPVQRRDHQVRPDPARHPPLRRHHAERAGRGHRVQREVGERARGLRRPQRRVDQPGRRHLAAARVDPAAVPERAERLRLNARVPRGERRGLRHHRRLLHRHAPEPAEHPRLERRRLRELRHRPRGRGTPHVAERQGHGLRAGDEPERDRREHVTRPAHRDRRHHALGLPGEGGPGLPGRRGPLRPPVPAREPGPARLGHQRGPEPVGADHEHLGNRRRGPRRRPRTASRRSRSRRASARRRTSTPAPTR